MSCSVQFIFSSLASDPDYSDLVTMYVEEMPDRMEQIRKAFESTDRDRLVRLIHQLKGAAGSYGFAVLTQVAADVEQTLLEENGENDLDAINRLLETCERVRSGTGE